MRHLFKLLAILIVLGGTGLIAFAYVGDLSPARNQVSAPVELNGR